MPVNPHMARVYFRDQKGGCATYVSREAAAEYVSKRLAVWNSTQSAIMLVRSEREVRSDGVNSKSDRSPRFQRAESLSVGKRVMDKAVVEDSGYHRMLAEAYRRSPDDHTSKAKAPPARGASRTMNMGVDSQTHPTASVTEKVVQTAVPG